MLVSPARGLTRISSAVSRASSAVPEAGPLRSLFPLSSRKHPQAAASCPCLGSRPQAAGRPSVGQERKPVAAYRRLEASIGLPCLRLPEAPGTSAPEDDSTVANLSGPFRTAHRLGAEMPAFLASLRRFPHHRQSQSDSDGRKRAERLCVPQAYLGSGGSTHGPGSSPHVRPVSSRPPA